MSVMKTFIKMNFSRNRRTMWQELYAIKLFSAMTLQQKTLKSLLINEKINVVGIPW